MSNPVTIAGFTLLRTSEDFTAFNEHEYDWFMEPKSYPAFGCEVQPYFVTYLYPEDVSAMAEAITGKRECPDCHRMRTDVHTVIDPLTLAVSLIEVECDMCVDCYNERMQDV